MENNVGSKDQVIRITLGALTGLASIGILAGYLEFDHIFSFLLGMVSVGLLVTGFRGKCGLYELIGIDTCKVE